MENIYYSQAFGSGGIKDICGNLRTLINWFNYVEGGSYLQLRPTTQRPWVSVSWH